MTAIADARRTDLPQEKATQVPESPRERLKRGRPLKQKDVETSIGRFRMREVTWTEKEDADHGVVQMEGDGKGNVRQTVDVRGQASRQIATALINDDGSNVYADPLGEGAAEVGKLPRDVHEKLKQGYDELNPVSAEAQADLVKPSAKAAT